MFSPELIQLSVMALAALSVGAIVYVFVAPFLSGERKQEKRVASLAKRQEERAKRASTAHIHRRRKQVQDTLKELEARKKEQKKVSLAVRLSRAGLGLSVQGFYLLSAALAVGGALLALLSGAPLWLSLATAFVMGIGFPRWLLKYLTKRRQRKFLDEFPNAIDVIVRGVKSGLPLSDCLQIIAKEAPDPVGPEFAALVEQQRVGLPLSQAFDRMYDHMPLPEVSFLAIVIAIQQQSGGNLAEALGNLSQVLRDRKKLDGKVRAFSAEAKSSAAIIASLPLFVMGMVFLTTPDYMSLMFTEKLGQFLLMGSAVWMLIGVLIMRKMINFDY